MLYMKHYINTEKSKSGQFRSGDITAVLAVHTGAAVSLSVHGGDNLPAVGLRVGWCIRCYQVGISGSWGEFGIFGLSAVFVLC